MDLEKIFTVHVQIVDTVKLNNNDGDSVFMLSFKGHVTGDYFNGEILDGGVDTQIIGRFGDRHTLSARYMLEGKDHTGELCKIYIENNGNINNKLMHALFRTHPKITTNSKALAFLNDTILVAEGVSTESGIDINIYKIK